jgi:hypothetical protein
MKEGQLNIQLNSILVELLIFELLNPSEMRCDQSTLGLSRITQTTASHTF